MSKKDVQIDRWFYEIPDLIPDSEGKTVIVKIKSFGPLEVFEWGIGSDGVPYELYNWCENDLCEHENYCRPTTAETLWKKIKATPHDHRLWPLCAICLPNFRHNTQFHLVLRQ